MTLDDILADFDLIEDWEDRYRHLIDLGKTLEPLPETARTEANKVRGCASQVWLDTRVGDGADPVLTLRGDSDAYIVRGLVALALAIFSGKRAGEIAALDAWTIFAGLGLADHLTPQRANGVRAMIERIKAEARAALAERAGAA
ncbi:MAG: SufE family protein [Hyphomicrobiales bacterium]|nr:SufE family protein [Hyphomicrobiales bacterium]MDE2017810.1 SufE family protein [Hyphomicrobiales bacterium]